MAFSKFESFRMSEMCAIITNGWNAQDEESSTMAQINSNLRIFPDVLLRYIASIIVLYF